MKKYYLIIFIIFITIICTPQKAFSKDAQIKSTVENYFLYDRESFLNLPHKNNLDHLFITSNILDEQKAKYEFLNSWNSRLNKNFYSYDYTLDFIDITRSFNQAKVHVKRNLTFSLKKDSYHKSFNEDFIFILENEENKWKINNMILKEENELYYLSLNNNPLNERSIYTLNLWVKNLHDIDSIYEDYTNSLKKIQNSTRHTSKNYNKTLAANYAQKHALNYNNNYKSFNNSGGDCTNFVSQSLEAGGLKPNSNWKPYTSSWINVNLLRDYLIFSSLAKEEKQMNDSLIGCPIQFFNNELQRYSHSGILSSVIDDTDYGYCAHSYDKLDYPLSLSYPLIYKKIRILEIL